MEKVITITNRSMMRNNMENVITITEKNKHLQDWRYVHSYPYKERWVIEEEIRESKA